HGKGVEVHPGNNIKGALGQHTRVCARLALSPQVEQATKGTQQKMPGAAGRVNQTHVLQTEPVQSRVQRVVQDEFLDEHPGLQQSVLLARLLRWVLVQVTEKTRTPAPTRKERFNAPVSGTISRQNASSRMAPSPEGPRAQRGVLPSVYSSRTAGSA